MKAAVLDFCCVLACTALILSPALWNGFPFVYSDTGTYLRSAFEGYVPIDRPFWYGAFVRLTSLNGSSLWGVAVAQSVLCASYLLRSTKLFFDSAAARVVTLVGAVLISALTSIGWYAGQLIPDVFTGIGLLAVLLLLREERGCSWRTLHISVIVLAGWMHLSNLLILPFTGLVLALITRRTLRQGLAKNILMLVGVTGLSWGGLSVANRLVDDHFYISRASHVFFMGRMLDSGMLKAYLDEHCADEHFGICTYKDSLPPNSDAFLWWGSSPVTKQGGWEATRDEYGRIVRGSFTEPKYLFWHLRASLISTGEQLCAWSICRGLETAWYRDPGSPPYTMIASRMPHELNAYLGSRQNGGNGELSMRWPDRVYRLALGVSLLAVVVLLLKDKKSNVRPILLLALIGVVLGAWVCASLSVVDTRYLGRDAWLIVWAAWLAMAQRSMPAFSSAR
jgi:hypothetical protein